MRHNQKMRLFFDDSYINGIGFTGGGAGDAPAVATNLQVLVAGTPTNLEVLVAGTPTQLEVLV